MDPNQSWHNPELIRPKSDAHDKQSMKDANRSYLSKKVLAYTAFTGTALLACGVYYLVDISIIEKDRQAGAPEISLARYLHHLKLGTRPVVNTGSNIFKPRYVQISGFASFEGGREVATTNDSYYVRTYRFDSTNSFLQTGSNGVVESNDIANNPSNLFSVRFQTRESLSNPSPFPSMLQEQTHPIAVSITVPTVVGNSVNLSSNELRLSPMILRVKGE